MNTFYLGTHKAHWLSLLDIPLFVSRRSLAGRRGFPVARAPWIQDSGGFTELSLYGCWLTDSATFIAQTRRHMVSVGSLAAAAPQDWMCEPAMLAKTGYSVRDHIRATVANYCSLMDRAPEVPWFPVLQGWSVEDYKYCAALYADSGVTLSGLPLVGIGSICRRQHTIEVLRVTEWVHSQGIRAHGLGVKLKGLRQLAAMLVSSDSLAWSFHARRRPPLPGHAHKNCANCLDYALLWRARLIESLSP